LRYTVFTWVTSLVVFSSKKTVPGVWCDECRKKVGRKYAMRSLAFGLWGIPWGVAWTVAAVVRGLSGGEQVKNANAVLLRAVGVDLIRRGDVPEARRALEASLNYEYDHEVSQWLQIQPKPPTPPPPPSPRTQPGRSQTGERKGRPWYIKLIGVAFLILVLRAVAGPGTAPVPTPDSRPPRTTSVPQTATESVMQSGPAQSQWGFTSPFDRTLIPNDQETDVTSTSITQQGLVMDIKAPGGIDQYVWDALPSDGRDFRFRLDIASTDGWGEVIVILQAANGDLQWSFSVDPVAQSWSLYRTSDYTSELFYWINPRPYEALAPGPLRSLEVRVMDGVPALWINGKDIVTPTGLEMPEMPESLKVGFGAGINPTSLTGHGETFSVVFESAALREL
jgi:hypothetical protein